MVNVKGEDKERVKEKRFWDISSMDVSIREDEGGIFSGKGLYLVNNVTGEEYIVDDGKYIIKGTPSVIIGTVKKSTKQVIPPITIKKTVLLKISLFSIMIVAIIAIINTNDPCIELYW